ncbi:sulfurtransferase TusA family protein [Plasticicumulans acidivorans]|uniref:tRNA 2-thiouridine synthesizing protein A n=1 Tax=Plasticicumulans acidivorans TaxID=886464 RepID=A0A317MQM3_9GAMM|nr:sulfurtransferase TusA family protein [Plasticicumulans acidivorans]PWV58339.1 tRNA 2-thiouridine synthesizing protein A [Plasticicumulans acidivorans]
MNVSPDLELDAAGLQCPLPILKTKKALATLQPGQVLLVITTDPGSVRDFEAYARQTGHELLDSSVEGACFRFLMRKSVLR